MSGSRLGRRAGVARLRASVSVLTVTAVLAAGGTVVGVTSVASAAVPATKPAPLTPRAVVPGTSPGAQVVPARLPLPPAPKVAEPAEHPNGSGKQPGASSDQIAALQAQLPLGLGSKGTNYVPPVVVAPEVTALETAKATGKPIEIVSDRTETASVAAQPNGTFTKRVTSGIQNVQQNGSWVPVNTTLTPTGNGLHPGAVKGTLTLSGGGSTAPAATFSDGAGHTVTLPATSSLPAPTVAGNTATYPNVMPNVDLTQSALTSGLDQSLIVKSRPSAALSVWKLPIQLAGLTAVADKTGVIDLQDASGTTVLVSGAPTATDSAGNFTALQQTLVQTGAGSYELDVTPDQQWLADPSTVFPVTIDPSTSFAVAAHTYVDSNNPTTNYSTNNYVYAGSHAGQTLRAFAQFATGASVGLTVNSATVYFHIVSQANSARYTTLYDTSAISTATTYNHQPTFNTAWTSSTGTGTGGWQGFAATSLMSYWASHNVYNGTVGLKGVSETDTSYYKQYDSGQAGGSTAPHIDINYNSAAGLATGLAATHTSTFAPTLSGTSVNADGGNVTSYFYVQSPGASSADIVNGAPVTVPSGSAATYTLQLGLVRANTTYTWWMNSCSAAGLCSGATAYQTFTIDPLLGAGNPENNFSFTSFGLTDKSGLKVNNATGNVMLQTSDVTLPGRTGDVTVGRTYNSLAGAAGSTNQGGGGTGYGWQMSGADAYIGYNSDGSMSVYSDDGSVQQYLPGCTGWCTPRGIDADLAQNGSGDFTLTYHASNRIDYFNGANGELTDIADRNGNKTHYTYTDNGCGYDQVSTITSTRGDSAGHVLHVAYNTTIGGCPRTGLSQTDSASNTRSVGIGQVFSGVNYGREYQTTDANGNITYFNYDGNGNLNQIVTPAGRETDIAYDSSHRATTITQDPSGIDAITNITYPAVGRVDVQDPMGHSTRYYSDTYGEITSVYNALGLTQTSVWTSDHKVGSTTNAESTPGTTSYDWSGNGGESLKGTQFPGVGAATGASTTIHYPTATPANPAQHYLPTDSTDTNSKSQYYSYGMGPGNLESTANGSGSSPDTAKATYAADGRLLTSTEPNNVASSNATTFGYDATGSSPTYNATSVTPPTGNTLVAQTFTYDGFGRLKTATSGKNVTSTYTYDNLDRVTATNYSSGATTVSNTFNGDGNLTQRVDASGTTGYAYDNLGRLTGKNLGSATVTCPSSPSNTQLCYSYDKAGNLSSLSDGRGTTVYSYDSANNLSKVVEGQSGNVDSFAYNAENQRTDSWYKATGGSYFNGRVYTAPTGFAAHIAATIDPQTNRFTALKTSRASNDSTLVQNQTFTYTSGATDTNVRQSMTDHIPTTAVTTTYGYDTTGRLVSAAASSGTSYYYCYDSDGNITAARTSAVTCSSPLPSPDHSYNTANQMTDTGMGNDADGNVTSSLSSTPGLSALAYNGADQTTSIQPSGGSTDTFGYASTGQNERTAQSQPSSTGYANGLTGLQSQTFSTGSTYFERDPSGTLLAEQTPTGEYYYYTDGSGSVIGLVDTTGAQVATYTYDPYGGHANVGAGSSPNTNIANANPYRYSSTYLDPTTGLYQMGARYYDPNLGRFTQLDPMGHLLDLRQGNRYGYASDDPVNNSDPTGRNTAFQVGPKDTGNLIDDVGIGLGVLGILAIIFPVAAPLLGIAAGLGGISASIIDEQRNNGNGLTFVVGLKYGFIPFAYYKFQPFGSNVDYESA